MTEKLNPDNLKIIFGIKIKAYRTERGLSLQELSQKSGIALSYLSEIESGKKYPKPEKLVSLAQALGVDYDELVSLKVDKSLDPFAALINSELIKQFPFHLFGISARDILGLFKNDAEKAHAFLQTFLQISRAYDMSVETFLFAALRTFQQLHHNYFPELEENAEDFARKNGFADRIPELDQLKKILREKYGYRLEEDELSSHQNLKRFRSVLKGEKHLFINNKLLPSQKAFILAREIAFLELDLTERPLTSSWIEIESFDQLVNNFKASYFAGALLIAQQRFGDDLKKFFARKTWSSTALTDLLARHQATPEMLFHRMSQLLPGKFNLPSLFYMRFTNSRDRLSVNLTKELNMTDTLISYGLGISEHYCRRWLPLRLLKEVRQNHLSLSAGIQKIHFVNSGSRFLLIGMARPLSLASDRGSTIAIGLKIDKKSEALIKFLNDPVIEEEDVGETCERCPLTNCVDRVVEASIISRQNLARARKKAIRDFIQSDNS